MKNKILALSMILAILLCSCSSSNNKKIRNLSIGDKFQGGIVAYIEQGGKHGLIVSETDLAINADWEQARSLCEEYKIDEYTDWYLPTIDELIKIYNNRDAIGAFPILPTNNRYWSSTIVSMIAPGNRMVDLAECLRIGYGEMGKYEKHMGGFHVRAVRRY